MAVGRLWRSVYPIWGTIHHLLFTIHGFSMEFSPAERQNIVKYLNDQFYRFK